MASCALAKNCDAHTVAHRHAVRSFAANRKARLHFVQQRTRLLAIAPDDAPALKPMSAG